MRHGLVRNKCLILAYGLMPIATSFRLHQVELLATASELFYVYDGHKASHVTLRTIIYSFGTQL
jgi:hypothetical protein